MLFAYQPEGLIATAIIAIVAAIAIPIYSRLGFNSLAAVGLGIATSLLTIAGLILLNCVADMRDRRRSSSEPDSNERPSPPPDV